MYIFFIVSGIVLAVRGIFLLFIINEQNIFKYFKQLSNLDVEAALSKGKSLSLMMTISGTLVVLSGIITLLKNTGL